MAVVELQSGLGVGVGGGREEDAAKAVAVALPFLIAVVAEDVAREAEEDLLSLPFSNPHLSHDAFCGGCILLHFKTTRL